MINLIRNELLKLHRRHFFLISFIVIILSLIIFTAIYYAGVDTRADMDIVNEQLEREKTYFSQIETFQWETDLEMQSAILNSQATIDKLTYMLDHQIPVWDWRNDVLGKYFTNQAILGLIAAGQDPADYGYTDLGSYDSLKALSQRITSLCEVQMKMVEDNDYMSYSKDQLASLQQQYSQNYTKLSRLDATLLDIKIESWKQYIQYQTPPGAVDQWKSVAIAELQSEREWIARYQYDETAFTDLSDEAKLRQLTWNKRRIRINEYALKIDRIPLSIYEKMGQNANTKTYSTFLVSLKAMMRGVLAICILLAAFIMSDEFSRGTIHLLVSYPFSRSKIALSKLITYIFTAFIFTVTVMLFGIIAGRVFFSNQMIGASINSGAVPQFLTYVDGNILELPFYVYVLLHYFFEFLKIVVLGCITLMISTLTESFVGPAFIMMILGQIGAEIIDIIYVYVYPIGLFRYMLFGNFNFMQYFEGMGVAPFPTAITSVIVILVVTLASLFLYFADFKYKEVDG